MRLADRRCHHLSQRTTMNVTSKHQASLGNRGLLPPGGSSAYCMEESGQRRGWEERELRRGGGAAQNLSWGWSWEHPKLGLCPSMAFW